MKLCPPKPKLSPTLLPSGPEFAHPKLLKVALGPLVSVGTSFQYPPVNWSTLLAPLMRLNFGKSAPGRAVPSEVPWELGMADKGGGGVIFRHCESAT